jgi:hypothetical protein
MRLGIDNDLVGRVDGRDAGVALNDALARRHFRTVIIRAITLADGAFCAAPIVGMSREPRP